MPVVSEGTPSAYEGLPIHALNAALLAAEKRAEEAEGLLRRLAEWDMLYVSPEGKAITGDAPYWQAEIARVLAAEKRAEEAEGREDTLEARLEDICNAAAELIAAVPGEWDGGALGYLIDGLTYTVESGRAALVAAPTEPGEPPC